MRTVFWSRHLPLDHRREHFRIMANARLLFLTLFWVSLFAAIAADHAEESNNQLQRRFFSPATPNKGIYSSSFSFLFRINMYAKKIKVFKIALKSIASVTTPGLKLVRRDSYVCTWF
jgi:hypothetical protein